MVILLQRRSHTPISFRIVGLLAIIIIGAEALIGKKNQKNNFLKG